MNDASQYGAPLDERETDTLADILNLCFLIPLDTAKAKMIEIGMDCVRVWRENGQVVAGCWLVPMGQFFGGRSVPMTGIAAVGVAPQARGKGVAQRMMQAIVAELHEQDAPLSALYPASQQLYRLAGYEPAGHRYFAHMTAPSIRMRERGLSIREATEEDRDAVKATYTEYARRFNGLLDRGPYVWHRVFTMRDEPTRGFLIEDGDRIVGYVYYIQAKAEPFGYDLNLTDLVALNAQAGRRLWTFLASHGSMAQKVAWYSGPNDPLISLLPELATLKLELSLYWSLRIVNPKAALEARGYPEGLTAEVHFRLDDPSLPANSGDFVLTVADGRGQVREGGKGEVKLSCLGLAALYSSFLAPRGLRDAGMLEGPEQELTRATAVFAGSVPWMRDMF